MAEEIRRLNADTINRIAAGEVIERPAAAVKELVENALDAGAGRIRVVLEEGGVARILVADDGRGMAADELPLAIERHATSKLRPDDDLRRIGTLGFRGEALASIGAAARLAIVSRRAGAAEAWRIAVDAGAVTAVTPAAGRPGTTVEVRDLFHATPARRKFLRSARAEAAHAITAVRRLALAWPSVAFLLELDGATLMDVPVQTAEARRAALLGAEAAPALRPVALARDGVSVTGAIAAPPVSRPTNADLFLTVNRRPVADPGLRGALRAALRDFLPAGRFPVADLHLTVPDGALDVNVHPAKTEVRFAAADAVRGLLVRAVQQALSVPLRSAPPMRLVAPPAPQAARPGFGEALLPLAPPPSAMPAASGRAVALAPAPVADQPLGTPVAQVMETYILAVAPDGGIVLVDQHAAHERLTHEALRAQHLAGAVASQTLLLPAVVDLPPAEALLLLDARAGLERLGLVLEGFGTGAVLVRAVPALLTGAAPGPLLRDVAQALAGGEQGALAARLDAVIARMACHGSVRAGRRLGGAEMDALLRRMEATPHAGTCSHGRPTWIRLGQAELERMFSRR